MTDPIILGPGSLGSTHGWNLEQGALPPCAMMLKRGDQQQEVQECGGLKDRVSRVRKDASLGSALEEEGRSPGQYDAGWAAPKLCSCPSFLNALHVCKGIHFGLQLGSSTS